MNLDAYTLIYPSPRKTFSQLWLIRYIGKV